METKTTLAVYRYTIIVKLVDDGIEHTWECKSGDADSALELFEDEHQHLPDHELMSVSRGEKVGEWRFVPIDERAPVPAKSRNVVPLVRKR